jgi:hypothetical protein
VERRDNLISTCLTPMIPYSSHGIPGLDRMIYPTSTVSCPSNVDPIFAVLLRRVRYSSANSPLATYKAPWSTTHHLHLTTKPLTRTPLRRSPEYHWNVHGNMERIQTSHPRMEAISKPPPSYIPYIQSYHFLYRYERAQRPSYLYQSVHGKAITWMSPWIRYNTQYQDTAYKHNGRPAPNPIHTIYAWRYVPRQSM